MYCGKCGSLMRDGWDFCINCGYRKKPEAPDASAESARQSSPAVGDIPAHNGVNAPIDRAAQVIRNAAAASARDPLPAEGKKVQPSSRHSDRAATVAYNAQSKSFDERTKVYFKGEEPVAKDFVMNDVDEREDNHTYADGYTDYYSENVIRERIKQPIAAYIVSFIGLLDFVLIFFAYNGIKLFELDLKNYGLVFIGVGAVLMLVSFMLYSVHRKRYGLDFAGATGMIVSIGAFIVMILLMGLGAYTWLSTSKFLDLPKLPADIEVLTKF